MISGKVVDKSFEISKFDLLRDIVNISKLTKVLF
jgi:hypothetical protein